MKLVFKNDAELVIPEFTDPIDVVKTYNTIVEIGEEFAKFSPENVSTIKVYDDDGVMFAQFEGMFFCGVSVETIVTETGIAFEAHFSFRQKTQLEILAGMIASLQETQDIQDGAIEDIASEVFG